MRTSHGFLVLLISLTSFKLAAGDELWVADVFTDNAVLQHGVDLPVWGTATPEATVTVRFSGQLQTVQADDDGSWRLNLSPLDAESRGETMVVESSGDRVEFCNVVVGEVWYASGQSNMQMTLAACARKIPAFRELVEAEATDDVRWLRIDEPDSPKPLARRQTVMPWQVDDPANRSKQSAVAFFFARALRRELGVPIGVIDGSWGGKPIEGFIPGPQFEKHQLLRRIRSLAEQGQYDELAALPGGVVIRNTAGRPGRIFNARVAPVAPFAVRGFLWYQGESNAGRGEDPREYRTKMQALIDGWRGAWGQSDLPFYFVQLPAFRDDATGWVRLREEQLRSLRIDHTGMAVTIDLRDNDIHPSNKLDVGERLARLAFAHSYGRSIPSSGPLFKSATVEGNQMRVQFQHADSGLMVARKEGLAEPEPTPDVELAHFELADETGRWHPANATIDDSAVLVHSEDMKRPTAVRYACAGAPANANLYNRDGLPASPFCSDLRLLPWPSDGPTRVDR